MQDDIERLIGKQIAKMRKERSLTQAQLAELVDVAFETISRLERGVSIPSLKTLENISRALNISLKDIFDFKYTKKTKPDYSEREIDKIIALLKYRRREEIRLSYTILRDVLKALRKL